MFADVLRPERRALFLFTLLFHEVLTFFNRCRAGFTKRIPILIEHPCQASATSLNLSIAENNANRHREKDSAKDATRDQKYFQKRHRN